ncbi:fungal-specific transcription factor domain-containing protein [Collybia nuda]|uniref:Fungal-specific transcription factor domain-containing protein n=1 Tax=Collybia nuda TaxID=64659 RepID=A0A9P6CHR3_9AGAR|nr:fungal-specific transcription factor domain-containing protein [Collybia nuda]
MDPYSIPQNPSSSSFLPSNYDNDDKSDQNATAFMKAPKRKRLAKACDACHKSKRRCDGTAPCSNCYYASKACSYTDASGRPVPAPRPFKVERPDADNRSPHSSTPSSHNPGTSTHDRDHSEDDGQNTHLHPHPQNNAPRKRFRSERGIAIPTENISAPLPLPMMETIPISLERPDPVELDHSLTRELTNLFFTHCHPARAIIHKPTFSASLAHNRVPLHLLHAVCALAAPLSKQPRLRTSPTRNAGKRFAQEALSLMFDGAGRLMCERNLATAQALCLLQIHEVSTKDKNIFWNSRYYADLALQIVESLNVYHPEHPTLTPVPSPEFIHASIEREAVRRIFWLVHLMDVMASIYFKRPMVGLGEQGMRLRLPADETSFELGVHSTLPEYLYLPAVRTQYSSEFGHLIRVISIYTKVEFALDELSDPSPEPVMNPTATLKDAEQMLEAWASSLPEHLRFSEQSLLVQQSMFETSSNTGAWCWCCMHIYRASTALALSLTRPRHKSGSPEPQWAMQTLDMILNMLGDRAKNSILMRAALWSMIKYCNRDDSKVRAWCADYEDTWGTRMHDIVSEWRPYPSPQLQPQYLPSQPHPHQQPTPLQPIPHHSLNPHQQAPHRRISEVRNPNQPVTGPRTSSHQHDSSYNRRSPGSSSPTAFPIGRSLDEHRLNNSNGSNSAGRSFPPQTQAHADRDVNGPLGQGQGGNGGSGEVSSEREKENGGVNGDNAGQRGLGGSSGDGPHSLPSLKSSGLLDSWSSIAEGGNGQISHVVSATQRPSPPRRSPPHPHSAHDSDSRSTTLVSMPVGLPWLANESR